MKPSIALIVSFSLLVPALAPAQPSGAGNPAAGARAVADEAWNTTISLAAPTSSASRGVGPKTADEVQADLRAYADQQRLAAQSAKDFYANHPSDSRVPLAKKLEATGLLKAAWPPAADRGQVAIRTATAFANDRGNATKDRVEVMAQLASLQHRIRTDGGELKSDPVAHEKTAEMLHAEFGDVPEVFEYWLGVVDAADAETAHRAALKIVQSPAPESLRRQAQVAIGRHALLGGPLNIPLRDTRGRPVNLRSAGRPTVLCVWSARAGGMDWAALAAAKKAAPANTHWVFVALDTSEAELGAAMGKLPFQATQCVLTPTQRTAFVKGLKVRRVPFVYLLARGGNLSTYGHPTDLTRLMSSLTQ